MADYNGDLSDEEALNLALSLSLEKTAGGDQRFGKEAPEESSNKDLFGESSEGEEPRGANPVSEASWNTLVESLISDFVKSTKDRRLEDFRHLRQLVSDSGYDQVPVPTEPPLRRSNLNSLQHEGLLKARWRMYNRLIDLGELWAEQAHGIRSVPRVLDGHHLAGTINLLNLPIRQEDALLMVQVAKDVARPHAREERVDAASLFIQKFEQLLPLARRPGKAVEVEGESKFARKPLPAFDVSRAPMEFYAVVDWPGWCLIFDDVKLRVEKSGLVW